MIRQMAVPYAFVPKDDVRVALREGRDWTIQHYHEGSKIEFLHAITINDGDSIVNQTRSFDLPDELPSWCEKEE